jgi:hypothetical protein
VPETEKPQQFVPQRRDIEDMLRTGYGHIKEAQFIVVRQRTAVGPASASFSTPIICSSLNRDFFMTRFLLRRCH